MLNSVYSPEKSLRTFSIFEVVDADDEDVGAAVVVVLVEENGFVRFLFSEVKTSLESDAPEPKPDEMDQSSVEVSGLVTMETLDDVMLDDGDALEPGTVSVEMVDHHQSKVDL